MSVILNIEDSDVNYYETNNLDFDVSVVNRDGAAQDLTGATAITFTVAKTVNDTSFLLQKTLGSGITITDEAGGLFSIAIVPADTADIIPEDYIFEIKITLSDGKVGTVLQGNYTQLGSI